MGTLKQHHAAVSTILAFALIPLSGFATDIYLPSFPAMASFFGTGESDIQLSLAVFVISNGVGQFFVGALVDSFGRYRLSILSLVIFALSSVIIAVTDSIAVLLAMRVVQGVTVAIVVVSKRAFFIDLYSGNQLKHFTSLFSIMWAAAPIVAPFIGGFLQYYFGWESNFYFLAAATLAILLLEISYSGETLKSPQPFKVKPLLSAYSSKLTTPDFVVSLVILGSAFSSVIVYNMASPFIIENVFHKSAVTIGNCSLFSGLALMAGGLISKRVIKASLYPKLSIAVSLLIILSSLMAVVMFYLPGITSMMIIIILYHMAGGFTFNTIYTHALGRFSNHAGIVSGIVGGGTYILASVFSYGIISLIEVNDPAMLGIAYFITAVVIALSFVLLEVLQPVREKKVESHAMV